MKVTSGNLDAVTPAKTAPAASPAAAAPAASFPKASALENRLASVPDVRPEAVARAKDLINDSSYPSAGVIKQLAGFMADKLNSADA